MYPFQLVPDDFEVPEVFETHRLRLRPLTINDLVKDFTAVMESQEKLRNGFEPENDWPLGLTLEQDLIDLGWHQREFQERASFAYTVVDLDETRVLGCMYINPTRKPGYDAEVSMWVRESESNTGLDEHLFKIVKKWIKERWPFENPGYPGRLIPYDNW